MPASPIAHSTPDLGTGDAAVSRLLGASAAMRRCDDPDRVLDVLITTMSMLVPARSFWAGWKSPGAPLGHVTVSDLAARSGPAPAAALEAALEGWAERLAAGRPPFQVQPEECPFVDRAGAAPELVAFPMSSASRVGVLLVSGRLADLTAEAIFIGLLCDQTAAALELVSARGTGRRAETVSETLTQLTASYLDPEVILKTIVRSAVDLLDADAAYVMLADDQQRLRVRTAHGITRDEFFESTFGIDELFVGDAIRERRVICVRDVQEHAESVNSRTEGLRTTICAPMFVADELVGVLLAANREVRERSPDDRRILTALASAAAVAIVNSRLHAERESSLAALGDVNELLDARSRAGERTLAFQRQLTTLVLEGGGLEDVVTALTAALRCQVAVLDRELVVLHTAGPGAEPDHGPLRDAALAFQLGQVGGAPGRTSIEPGRPLVAPLEIAGEHCAYVVVSVEEKGLEGAELGMTEAGVTAIGLELMRDRAAAEAEARLTGGLFQALLADGPVDEAAIARSASFLGYEFSGANAVIAARAGNNDKDEFNRRLSLETCVHRVLRRSRDVPTVVFERDETIFVVLSDPDHVATELVEEHTALIKQELAVSGRSRGVRIAFAGPHRGIGGVRRAAGEAAYALRVLGILGREGKPQAFGDLGIWTLLGSVGDPKNLTTFADGVLGTLIEHDAESQPRLLETLRALVACNFHYRTAADELFAHPNTLRYRMIRIGELTGLDFSNADDRLRVELALRALDVIEA